MLTFFRNYPHINFSCQYTYYIKYLWLKSIFTILSLILGFFNHVEKWVIFCSSPSHDYKNWFLKEKLTNKNILFLFLTFFLYPVWCLGEEGLKSLVGSRHRWRPQRGTCHTESLARVQNTVWWSILDFLEMRPNQWWIKSHPLLWTWRIRKHCLNKSVSSLGDLHLWSLSWQP